VHLTDDFAALAEGGDMAIWVAIADADCVPQTARSMGARVDREHGRVSVFVPDQQGARLLANARPGAILAATFVRIHDYRAVQVKGVIAAVRPCGDEDRRPHEYRASFADASERVGMSRQVVAQLVCAPCTVVEVDVRDLFAQTPGPNAGARL
jgi:hypothetical protein